MKASPHPEEQAWYRAMAAEPDVIAGLRHVVADVDDIVRRVTPLYVVARGNTENDEEIRPHPDIPRDMASRRIPKRCLGAGILPSLPIKGSDYGDDVRALPPCGRPRDGGHRAGAAT